MSEKTEQPKQQPSGLYLIGTIMNLESKTNQGEGKKDRFLVDVYVPGFQQVFRVAVQVADFIKFTVGDQFKAAVRFNVYKNAVYWMPV